MNLKVYRVRIRCLNLCMLVQTESETQKDITQSSELKEEDVLKYIKNTYDKDVSSVNDLFAEKEKPQELPEDVSAFLEYKKKTGRGFEDYVKLNRNFKDMDETQLLREYYQATEQIGQISQQAPTQGHLYSPVSQLSDHSCWRP